MQNQVRGAMPPQNRTAEKQRKTIETHDVPKNVNKFGKEWISSEVRLIDKL